MFNEIEMVKSYLDGKNIPVRALDDCIYYISKYCKLNGMDQISTKTEILAWLSKYNLHYVDINNNIDNAFKTKSQLIGDFCVRINDEDISKINFAADFTQSKRVALFLLIYAKLHSDDDGNFSIRLSTMSEWIGIALNNIPSRNIKPLVTYGFMKQLKENDYKKYLSKSTENKKARFKIMHPLVDDGKYIITSNGAFDELFDRIFIKG